MGQPVNGLGLQLRVSHVSHQKVKKVGGVDPQMSVGELLRSLVEVMDVPPNEPHTIHSTRAGRHLLPSELVGDVLEDEDQIELHPDISAG